LHWDKVDNFRIDKFLMFLRFQFNQVLAFMKQSNYEPELMKWYQKLIKTLFLNSQKSANTATGIPLQICDVFLKEMNKVDNLVSLDNLAAILDPFLASLSLISNGELKERIID